MNDTKEPPGLDPADVLERLTTARQGRDYAAIPSYMWEGILDHAVRHEPTGEFLTSVFANDFAGAMGRADTQNTRIGSLQAYALLLCNEIPPLAWGSKQKVIDWLSSRPRVCECGHAYERHHRLSMPGAIEDGPCAECEDCLKFTERAEPVTGSESDDQGEGGQADRDDTAAT